MADLTRLFKTVGAFESKNPCKACGAPIVMVPRYFKKHFEGWMPFDPDGTCHFETCPEADKNYTPKKPRKEEQDDLDF